MKWIRFASVIFLCFGIMILMNKIRFYYDWKNAFWRTLMAPFEGTIWAENYSEEHFMNIRPGMSMSSVEVLLGKPLRITCSKEGCTWIYSNQDTPTADYDRRWVSFSVNGSVNDITHKFYID